jgi:hypothetical protein
VEPAEAGTDAEDAAEEAEAGPSCAPPLVVCDNECVDLTSNPGHCGACHASCSSALCNDGGCAGAPAGAVIFIGHDYAGINDPKYAEAHVLTNAVFMTQGNLKVLSYERYAHPSYVTNVNGILTTAASQSGRVINITSTNNDADITEQLPTDSFQVLLVQDQTGAPSGALATLGSVWASTLSTFTQAGGVVVILDGGRGVGEMPQFTTATGLLSVTAQAQLINGTELLNVAPGDAVGVGVLSEYAAEAHTVSVTTEPSGGNVFYVIEEPSDGAPWAPVVVHKIL